MSQRLASVIGTYKKNRCSSCEVPSVSYHSRLTPSSFDVVDGLSVDMRNRPLRIVNSYKILRVEK